jgi:hypothetical protein
MDRDIARKVLEVYGKPTFKTEKGITISFSRQNLEDIENIEKLTTDELIQQWKSLVFINYIYESVSLKDMQRIDLIELEFQERGIEEDLEEWYKNKQEEFEKNQEL